MTDLYAALNVGRDATKAEIRKAYRKAAKRSHPDSPTGSRQKFAAVSTALAVLSDDDRRRYYDQTGKIEEPPADDRHAKAMNLVANEIGKIINTIQMRRRRVEEYDVIADARRGIKETLETETRKLKDLKDTAKKYREIAKRFKAKKNKVNRISPLLDGWAAQHEQTIARGEDSINTYKLAIAILDDHTFDVEKTMMGF